MGARPPFNKRQVVQYELPQKQETELDRKKKHFDRLRKKGWVPQDELIELLGLESFGVGEVNLERLLGNFKLRAIATKLVGLPSLVIWWKVPRGKELRELRKKLTRLRTIKALKSISF